MFDAGAQEVVVWDAHGTGVNLQYDLLDPRCRILLGSGHRGRFAGMDKSYTAVLFIGYHARENTSRAVLAHTFCSTAFQYYKLDGKEAGELAIDAAYAGELGVPVLFCAGDDACVAVCDDIYRTVRAAVPGAGTLVPYCMPGPLSVEIRYKRMEDAARAALTDRNGHPFAQPDPFTRSGVVDGVSALF